MIPPQGDPKQTRKGQKKPYQEISEIFVDDLFTADLHASMNAV